MNAISNLIASAQETVRFRALLYALIGRHVAIRYRGSVLGFLWTLLNPLCLMAIYTLVFHYYMRFAGVDNYALFLFCGLIPWIWASSSLAESASSIVNSGHLVTKAAFPAHLLTTVAVSTNAINFILSLPILFLFLLAAGMGVSWSVIQLPLLLAVNFLFLLGAGLIVGSLNVLYRDVQHIVNNLISAVFFLCPIIYPLSSIPEQHRALYLANPFALFTYCYNVLLFEGNMISLGTWGVLSGWTIVSLLCGILVYHNWREDFAEML